MDYIIRTCQVGDLNQLIKLIDKHAAYERAAYSSEGKAVALQQAIFQGERPLKCFVVEADEKLIGYATYTFDYSTWDAAWFIYLDCLYLEEHYRGYGIGQILMEEVQKVGEKRNCVNMQWQTPDFNERAIKFYKRIGGVSRSKVRFTLPL